MLVFKDLITRVTFLLVEFGTVPYSTQEVTKTKETSNTVSFGVSSPRETFLVS